jgi:hypothetical protein
VEPASGISFPQRLQTISQSDIVLNLLGLGVRTVSFLRVKVYAAGFYIDPEALKSIEKNVRRCVVRFVNVLQLIPSTDEDNSHSVIERLINQRLACGVRIGALNVCLAQPDISVPTRSTDFGVSPFVSWAVATHASASARWVCPCFDCPSESSVQGREAVRSRSRGQLSRLGVIKPNDIRRESVTPCRHSRASFHPQPYPKVKSFFFSRLPKDSYV